MRSKRANVLLKLGLSLGLMVSIIGSEQALASDYSSFDACGFDSNCIVSKLKSKAKTEDPNTVMSNYLNYMEKSSSLKASCHTVTHAFGQWVYEKYGANKFNADITGCLSGYMHGFLIGISKNSPNPAIYLDTATNLCKKIPSKNKKGLCVHGLGHGATFIVKSLPEANKLCLSFKESSLQLECIDGTAMEWNNSKLGTQSLTPSALTLLCQDLSRWSNLHRECLAQILQHQSSAGITAQKLKDFCDQKKGSTFDGCYEALGYLLVNQNFAQVVEKPSVLGSLIRVYCNDSKHSWCVTSIVSRGLSLTLDKNSGKEICKGINRSLQKVCSQAVDSSLLNLAKD